MGVRAAAAVGQSAAGRNLGSRGTMTAAVTGRSGQGQISVKLILIGAAILLSVGMGIRQSLGLFLTPMTRDLGIAAADFTLAIAMQNIVWGLSQAPVGALADRYGLRVTLIAGAAIYVAGRADSLKGGVAKASQLIKSGAAKQKMEEFVAFTQKLKGK